MPSPHAAIESLGVDVCLTKEGVSAAPECPHGPMLLFERFYKDGRPPRRFHACSAARDRKDCSFFQWEEEKVSETRKNAHKQIVQASREPYNEACDTYKKIFVALDEVQRRKCLFCHSCGLLFKPKEKEKHQTHDYQESGDTDQSLLRPTVILRPRENEKTQAQYFFSRNATEFLASVVKDLGFKNVLCVGTPRLHEEIQSNHTSGDTIDSLLLDIDFRYGQFFPQSKFCWYNMFNHFFFGSHTSEQTFQTFIGREGLVVVMDPPFGGLAEVLAASLKTIWDAWRKLHSDGKGKDLPTLWIFPYFMEPHIKAVLPSFNMLDYKVDYDNHPHFKSKQLKGSKRGSPVRIFTNINPSDVVLPSSEGYRFCNSCNRYIAPENVHCIKCNGCMSKDGRQYVHCEMCGTCVKPGLQHCITCDHCEAAGHSCKRSADAGACHICGQLGHKRRDCPTRSSPPKNRRKRKQSDQAKTVFSEEKTPGKRPRKENKKKRKTRSAT